MARHLVTPDGMVSTGWPQVRDTCARLGWFFDGWQDGAGRLILSKRADGTYAADTIVFSLPRQVGKTYLVGCIIFALCLLIPNLTVIWTAHRKSTAAETFDDFDAMAQRPKVKAHVRQVLRGKGDEKIIFHNGSRILFGARESGFGRGFTNVGILVFDEGQILKDETLEDMAAAQNVAANPLTFVIGTPPRPKDAGEFFTLLRQESIDGESEGTLYIEFSADRNCDPMDRAQWRKANPSVPLRTSEGAMIRLYKKLKNPDSWRREALGIWDEVSKHEPVVRSTVWEGLVDDGPPESTRPNALAVDMSHAREISVAACWMDGADAHCEEVWAGVDVDSAVEWIASRGRYRVPIVIDQMSPANSLIAALKGRRLNVVQTTASDMAKACGTFVDKVSGDRLTHADQQSINDSLLGARKRAIGTAGGWGWDRRDETVNIAPLVAVTLALFGATNSRSSRRDRSTNEGRAA